MTKIEVAVKRPQDAAPIKIKNSLMFGGAWTLEAAANYARTEMRNLPTGSEINIRIIIGD